MSAARSSRAMPASRVRPRTSGRHQSASGLPIHRNASTSTKPWKKCSSASTLRSSSVKALVEAVAQRSAQDLVRPCSASSSKPASPARSLATNASISCLCSSARRAAPAPPPRSASAGCPRVNASSGRQSSTSAQCARRACRPARAASCTRSCIGIGGSVTRVGRSPSQARSSRREVSRNLALVSRGRAQEVGQLALLGLAPRRRRAGGEAGHRLDVVPDPQHGDLLEDLQRHARRRCSSVSASHWMLVLLPARLEDAAHRIQHLRAAACSARTR